MYGAITVGSRIGTSDVLKKFDGGGTFAKNDLVMLSSGELVVATAAAENLLGVATAAGTSSSVNIEVNISPGLMVIMDNDNVGTTFAATHIGTKFDFVGATGVMQIDTSSTSTTGQLLCWEYNPQGWGFDADTSIGMYQLDETVFRV